jgi:glutathione S-transferase
MIDGLRRPRSRHVSEAVSDSFVIAEFLDNTYPDTPRLFPRGTRALQVTLISTSEKNVKLWPIMLPATHASLGATGQAYYREKLTRKKLEEFSPPGPVSEGCWKQVKQWFDVVQDGWLQMEEGPYFMGTTISFADIVLASYSMWIRKILGEESEEWKDIISWNGSRWGN